MYSVPIYSRRGASEYELLHYFQIENSQRIAVIGGGPVGVEIAAEIATDFPGKEVIIVHSRDKLLGPQLTKDFHKRLDEILDDLKVTRVLSMCKERCTNSILLLV